MADNASIARPYARAVFALASEANNHDAWTQALDLIASVVADESVADLLGSPQVKRDQLIDLLNSVCGDRLPEGGDNLVRLLVQNDRLETVADIQQQYVDLVAQAKQSINAEVFTAQALSEQQREKLIDALQTRLGVSVTLTESVDEELLGGAIVKAGDLVIDGSARGRIEKLASALNR